MTYGKSMLTLSRLSSLERHALQSQQCFLTVEAAGVADEPAVRADHAVTGEDDRDRVAVHRPADRSGGVRLADLRRERAVGRHVPEGDTCELAEHLALELRQGGEVGLEVEVTPVAGEVLVQLAADAV